MIMFSVGRFTCKKCVMLIEREIRLLSCVSNVKQMKPGHFRRVALVTEFSVSSHLHFCSGPDN